MSVIQNSTHRNMNLQLFNCNGVTLVCQFIEWQSLFNTVLSKRKSYYYSRKYKDMEGDAVI